MASAKTSDKKKLKKVVVIPLSPQTRKEGFAVCNANSPMGAKRIPFEREVLLTDAEIAALRRQKEPIQVDKDINVQEIMSTYQMPQSKANQLAQQMERDRSVGGKRITFTPRYHVEVRG